MMIVAHWAAHRAGSVRSLSIGGGMFPEYLSATSIAKYLISESRTGGYRYVSRVIRLGTGFGLSVEAYFWE